MVRRLIGHYDLPSPACLSTAWSCRCSAVLGYLRLQQPETVAPGRYPALEALFRPGRS